MKKICFILLLTLQTAFYGQSEIKINSSVNGDQRDPHIVTDKNGHYLVVWSSVNQISSGSKGDIFLQSLDADLNKTGNEIQVNDITEGDQIRPSAAMNKHGDYVIAWASCTNADSLYDIKAKLFINGQAPSKEFLVNEVTAYSQTKPSVDIYSDGSFTVAWESWFEDGSDRGIYGQRFFSDGSKNGSPFRVNITTKFSQAKPVIKYFPDGKFIVIWESWNQIASPSSGYDLFGRIYSSAGQPVSGELQINDYTPDYQWYADAVTIDDEHFVVAWCSWEQDGSDGGIYIRHFNTNGTSDRPEILVNSNRRYYQWLPKLALTPEGNIAVVWSSWQQDGSREGIYAKIFDGKFNEKSFEVKLNDTTENFQWEPGVVAVNDHELITVWSNYDETFKGYDVVGKRSTLLAKQPVNLKSGYDHPSGLSTASFIVSVIDSTLLTGDTYEIIFAKDVSNRLYSSIKNRTKGSIVIPELLLDRGEDVYYLTPVFDGIAVEIKPVTSLALDFDKSLFVNNSGSNVTFNFVNPSGTTVIAPIDLLLEWGDASKNPDGTFIAPLDSAYSSSGKLEIKTPFKVIDLKSSKRLDCYIVEPAATKNNRWDAGENIVILTPAEYQHSFPNFHVQINSLIPPGIIKYPSPGDSIYIFTKRPLTTDDVYTFSTSPQYVTLASSFDNIPDKFLLGQNFPNPFNPSTTISFAIPIDGLVKLKLYNILGELVTTIKNEYLQRGSYRVVVNSGSNGLKLASGVYFYSLESGNKILTKKMLLVK